MLSELSIKRMLVCLFVCWFVIDQRDSTVQTQMFIIDQRDFTVQTQIFIIDQRLRYSTDTNVYN